MNILYSNHNRIFNIHTDGIPYLSVDLLDRLGVPNLYSTRYISYDVVEDTDYTLDDLREMGFSEEVCQALDLLTHREGVPYMDYVRNIKSNPVAVKVKLADLAHNSDRTRFDHMTEFDYKREEKYRAAVRILQGEED